MIQLIFWEVLQKCLSLFLLKNFTETGFFSDFFLNFFRNSHKKFFRKFLWTFLPWSAFSHSIENLSGRFSDISSDYFGAFPARMHLKINSHFHPKIHPAIVFRNRQSFVNLFWYSLLNSISKFIWKLIS